VGPRAAYVPVSVAFITVLVLLGLAGLPLAVWLDLRSLSEHVLHDQADAHGSAINAMRSFYSSNVVARVRGFDGKTQVVHNYMDVPGAIPIPATLSLELGGVISDQNRNLTYRFFSDYPFAGRAPHQFDAFELGALAALRKNPKAPIYEVSGSIFDRQVRLVTPVIMGAECVSCHNSHPDSPKHDWRSATCAACRRSPSASPWQPTSSPSST
jgi:hypothetical protein